VPIRQKTRLSIQPLSFNSGDYFNEPCNFEITSISGFACIAIPQKPGCRGLFATLDIVMMALIIFANSRSQSSLTSICIFIFKALSTDLLPYYLSSCGE
jgi:hypothetical protein